nr:TRAP transporter small permease [Flavimaribacter sediminis]
MMLLVGVDIVGRHIASMPVTGAIELTEFAMGIAIFAALPSVALRNAHIRADLLSGNLGRRGRRVLEIASEIVGTLLFAALAWRLWIEGITVAGYGTTAGVLRLPLAPLTFYASALCALSALTHLLRMFDRPSREHPS